MSLISDALKKAQQERGQGASGEELPPQPPLERGVFTTKRMVIYGGLFVIIVIAVVLATVVFKPVPTSNMRALNIRQPQSQPAANQAGGMQPSPPPNRTTPPVQQAQAEQPQTQKPPVQETPAQQEPSSRTTAPVQSPSVRQTPAQEQPSQPPVVRETKPRRTVPLQPPVIKQEKKPVKVTPTEPAEVTVADIIAEGDDLMKNSQYAAAVEAYKKALKMERGPGIYLKLYSAFTAMKNRVLAKAYVDDGLKFYPDDFYLNKIAAVLSIRARDYGKAMAHVNAAIAKNDADYTLYTYRGLCYFHAKDYANGAVNFRKSLELNSDAVENYYYMGLIYDNREEYGKALEYYNAFFKLNDKNKNFKHRNWVVNRMRLLRRYIDQQKQQ